jgi:hypothetical protein
MEDLIKLVLLVVLLPIIPAYILYKTLPSRTKVSGPFKGLNIQLTGAFGGYFIVAFLTGSFITSYTLLNVEYELWTVEGKIQLKQGGFNPIGTIIAIKPPEQTLYREGRFVIENVPLAKKMGIKKPSLLIQKEGYKINEVTLETDPPQYEGIPKYKIDYDEDHKNISINTPIILERKPKDEGGGEPYIEETAQEATK